MPVRVTLDEAGIRALLTSPQGEVGRDLLRRARKVQAEAVRLAPVDRGTLRASITQEIQTEGGRLVARVGTNVNYAVFVHEGTRPHIIRPRSKKVLSFVWPNAPAAVAAGRKKGKSRGKSGPRVAFRFVHHPGTRARPFLRQALQKFEP